MLRTPLRGRRRPAILCALIFALLLITTAQADEPGTYAGEWTPLRGAISRDAAMSGAHLHSFRSWEEKAALTAQPSETCDESTFIDAPEGEIILVATDADLLAESDGSRLCLFFDTLWDSYMVWTLSPRTIEEFRETKEQLQPLIGDAGVDTCDIAFWTSFSQRLRREIELPDRYDAGKPCPAEVVAHGPVGEQRQREVEDAISLASDAARRLFDWELTWPTRVHIYDTFDDYVAGVQEEGGNESISRRTLENTPGITGAPFANGGFGQLVNLEAMSDPAALRRVVAHEYGHVAQFGVLGDPDVLPFFVTEGGAEYFASLIVGEENMGLMRRFRDATSDERTDQAVPLRELIETPDGDDIPRVAASYSRGYAAMRFLVSEWGEESFVRLHEENVDGTPERFIEALGRLTGTSLDGFDSELRGYLLSEAAKPVTIGRASFTGSSRLVEMATARPPTGDVLVLADRFTRTDNAVHVLFAWECLSASLRGEARAIDPAGRPFASFYGMNGPGCDEIAFIDLPLDQPLDGRTVRTQPGTWRVEIYADGMLQGSITFDVE